MWTIACSIDAFPLEFSFSALVLKESTNEQIVSQAMALTGVSYLLQARAMPFFSKRPEYLVTKLPVHYSQNTALRYFRWIRHPTPLVKYNIALTLAECGDVNKAFEELTELKQQNPFFTGLWPLQVLMTYQLLGYDAACKAIQEAIKQCGNLLQFE